MDDVIILVKVSGVVGVFVNNEMGVDIDFWGYVVVFYVLFYYCNEVFLDMIGIRKNIEFIDISKMLVFICGVVVRVEYKINIGYKVLMVLICINNLFVFFGVIVLFLIKLDNYSSFVGDVG